MGKVLNTLIIALLLNSIGWSQIKLNNKIYLTGDIDEDKQVLNISSNVNDLNDAINAEVLHSNQLNYSVASGNGNNVEINLPINPEQYIEGMSVYFKANATNAGAMTININNLGSKPIYKNVDEELEPSEVISGQIVHIIYDGSAFQLLSDINNSQCPTGFVRVNKDYCIEVDERAPASFWDAIITCGNIDAKLCSWDYWYYACQDPTISSELNNMTNSVWEWVDTGGNGLTGANPDANTANVVGETRCIDNWNRPIVNDSGDITLLPYRCCVNK